MSNICPYCKIQMDPTGHSSHTCNGWTCPNCNHEEPEMGSYSLAGRPDVDLSCNCKNCKSERLKNDRNPTD
jgi:hypothetical protein